MLPKQHRIAGRSFGPLLRRGRRANNAYVSAVFYRDSATETPQCACVVSKRVAKTAVLRNMLRRRCYGALQPICASLPSGTKMALFLRPGAERAATDDLRAAVASVVSRILNDRR